MSFTTILARARSFILSLPERGRATWRRFRSLPRWQQIVGVLLLLALLVGALVLLNSGKEEESAAKGRIVALASVGELSGTGGSVDLIGTVRSVTEANILAQNGGTVRSVRTRLGAKVPAGFIIAELENAAERAVVLQAEGVYEGALAARSITISQGGNTEQSFVEAARTVRTAYRTAYTSIDTTFSNDVDDFFTGPRSSPTSLVNDSAYNLSERRAALNTAIQAWRYSLNTIETSDPEDLIAKAEATTRAASDFLIDLALVANRGGSNATAAQQTSLATARSTVNTVLATLSTQREDYLAKKTAADVAKRQTVSTGGRSATSDASVKQALGALRGAQAALEKTFVRAPIGGQVNFLPIRVGDYVTGLQHVATVAQNGALEIVAYVSEDNRDLLVAGGRVVIDTKYEGIITSVAPALDPTTKQIEVHIAVTGASELVNGQSVHIALPDLAPREETVVVEGPVLLPLASVKLRAGDRIVFSVGADNRLIANAVEVGEVRGDRIEIKTPLPKELRIVADARGLAEGEQVQVTSGADVR